MTNLIVDIRPLLPKNPPSGIPEYTRELLKVMLHIIQKEQIKTRVCLFSSGSEKPDLQFLNKYKHIFRHTHLAIPNRLLNTSFKLFSRPKIDALVLKNFELQVTSYKLHDVTFFAPNINLFPLSKRAKLVVTFHDLSFECYPFFLKRRERAWHRAINPRAIARRADKIIAVSESTKQDLINLYGVDERKITVIYSGIGEEFKPKLQATSYKLKAILYLGSLEGRKNIETLKLAFTLVKKKLKSKRLNLTLAGPPHHPISDEKRLELYQDASLFVYPSFFEGFGLPPLEAMKCGVAVITSHTSSLPEAVGDAAITVNPHNVYELAQAMESLLSDEKLRAHYIKKGLERTKQFSWERTARETLRILLS